MTAARTFLPALLALALLLPSAAHGQLREPGVDADAAIVVDGGTGEVLFEKEPGERRSIASATKLMTALLVLERAEPDAVFDAADYDAAAVESQIGLRRGERMVVADLFEALMLESANDAAVTLAEGIAGSSREFVDEMNSRARELGLDDTRYVDPIGLDEDNRSSAEDLATLTRLLLENETFAEVVDQPTAVLETGARRRVVRNRNRLVARHPFVDGVKTGHTRRAGYVLVGSASGRGKQVVSVVLGEPSEAARDEDSLALLRYGIDQYRRVPALRAGRVVDRTDVRFFDDAEAALVTLKDVALTVRRGEEVRTVVDAPEELEGPLPAGERVGTVAVVYRGEVVRRTALVTAAEVPGAGTVRRLTAVLGVALTLLAILAMALVSMLVALRIRAVRRRRASA
ncbi:MAG: D-alanyl-D-alanine carboxypeptidase family protein [Thermoleophilaceae bacterium]